MLLGTHDHSPARSCPADPFAQTRAKTGALMGRLHGKDMVMLRRGKDVRAAARDHAHFDSMWRCRVPIPPKNAIRPFRRLPIKTNPPEHAQWTKIMLPFFRHPTGTAAMGEYQAVVEDRLTSLLAGTTVEMVEEFALPVQSAALAVLLDTDRNIAAEWQSWGLHAFRTDGQTDPVKAVRFLEFIERILQRGETDPGMGLFAALHEARFDGRRLTHDEMRGICHLALAGGRDTVINSSVGTLAYLAENPRDLERLRKEPKLIAGATEELFRVLSPLAQIGRVCPEGDRHGSHHIAPGHRASLCWVAANRDPDRFEAPDVLRIYHSPKPHVAFGAGAHTCPGAPMARLILRTLLGGLAARVSQVEIVDAVRRTSDFGTPHLFNALRARLIARQSS